MAGNIIDVEVAGIIAKILYPEDPGIVMTDFGAAFPSLLHDWLFFRLGGDGYTMVFARISARHL